MEGVSFEVHPAPSTFAPCTLPTTFATAHVQADTKCTCPLCSAYSLPLDGPNLTLVVGARAGGAVGKQEQRRQHSADVGVLKWPHQCVFDLAVAEGGQFGSGVSVRI